MSKVQNDHKNINLDEVYLINKLSIYNLSVRNFNLAIFTIQALEEGWCSKWWRTVFLQNYNIKSSYSNSTSSQSRTNLEIKNEDF